MCPRCNGSLIRDLGFEHNTHEGVAYHCVNCGNYIDLCILKNRNLTMEELYAVSHKRGRQVESHSGTFTLSGYGHVLFDRGSVLDLC